MVHGRCVMTTSEPRRSRWKFGLGGAFLVAGSEVGGKTVGRNSFNGVANFAASSADANSMATSVSGTFLLTFQAATNIRDDVTCSACALSHLTSDLNSFGGPASFRIGSSRSLMALE